MRSQAFQGRNLSRKDMQAAINLALLMGSIARAPVAAPVLAPTLAK